ncbi:hypothetical protein FB45DRAFT_1022395 [Roridomyces roridus]|uniref:F-box domain-containing protein n=1 Tax=Roridomyces roridus TaxID=1738132 RepID=A0AAD7C8K9_9AGAR|nr:hypothetical protein FB45DRAFT_1022395 [Roridomyces roridus]
MRNLHPSRFPTSVSTPVPVCSELPLDIFGFCSPFELVQLLLTSKFLRTFIRRNNRLWASSFSNISRGDCPPLPPPPVVEASGNYSVSSYVLWIFDGGFCSWCDTWTTAQPFHFLFRFRACSRKCRSGLLHGSSFLHDKRNMCASSPWAQWLPREAYTVEGIYRYSRKAIEEAEAEREQAAAVDGGSFWRHPSSITVRNSKELDSDCILRARDRPRLSQNAAELEIWQSAYFDEKAVVERANLAFMKRMCMAENKKVQGVLRCPAASSVFDAFNRDLELLTTTVWAQIRTLTLAQFKSMQEGVFPPSIAPRRTDMIKCEHCDYLALADIMHSHVRDVHNLVPDYQVSAETKIRRPAEILCPDCPFSRRSFNERSLRDHQRSVSAYVVIRRYFTQARYKPIAILLRWILDEGTRDTTIPCNSLATTVSEPMGDPYISNPRDPDSIYQLDLSPLCSQVHSANTTFTMLLPHVRPLRGDSPRDVDPTHPRILYTLKGARRQERI